MLKLRDKHLRLYTAKALYVSTCLALIGAGLLPLLVPRSASALQLTSRSLSISTGVASASTAQYTFTFTVASTSDVEGLKLQACTTAVGTCSAPAGLSFSSRTFGTQSGWQGATNFAVDATGANDCTASASVICANRTDATAQTVTSRSIRFDTITNPSTVNTAFFLRITTYSTNNYTGGSIVDTGTVASAITQTLTVNAAVAEVLNFCVGSTTVDDATTSVAGDCTGVSGTSLNIGTLDPATINISPVSTNGGDSNNGVAMLRTNAASGATVSYRAIQQSGTNHLGTLRVSGASCNAGTVSTDPCINAQGTTQGTFTAGTENYGMTIGGVNCGSNPDTNYNCDFASGAYNLVRDANYDGNGGNTYGTSQGFAWDETGTFDQVAASTTVVDDEALILRFASTPAITTPFGSYAAQADFVAVPTY